MEKSILEATSGELHMGPQFTVKWVRISCVAPLFLRYILESNMPFQKYGELHMGPYWLLLFLVLLFQAHSPSHISVIFILDYVKAYVIIWKF